MLINSQILKTHGHLYNICFVVCFCPQKSQFSVISLFQILFISFVSYMNLIEFPQDEMLLTFYRAYYSWEGSGTPLYLNWFYGINQVLNQCTLGVQSWQNFTKVVCRLGCLWAMKPCEENDFSGECFLVY